VVLPGDQRFDDARRAWNLAVDQRPAAVIFPESATAVAAAIGYAAERGLRVAAQGTGHNAGPLGALTDTVLLRTDRMRGIRIDPQARTARTEAGVVWLDVVRGAAQHGLAALAGSSPDVGVAGYTLGGGLSFLGRKYGLAASNVLAAEVVLADGRWLRVDPSTSRTCSGRCVVAAAASVSSPRWNSGSSRSPRGARVPCGTRSSALLRYCTLGAG